MSRFSAVVALSLWGAVSAWPHLYTSKNDCSAPTLGGEQDRSQIIYDGPFGTQVHQPMQMICEAVEGGGRDVAWCQDNCQILGGFPPVQRQSCSRSECTCLEFCFCNDGTLAEGTDCTGEKCPECDESLVFDRCPDDGAAAGPLAITEGSATLLIDGHAPEERGYTPSVPHNVTVVSGDASPVWFLLDVDQGHFESSVNADDKDIDIQCGGRRVAYRQSAVSRSIVWNSPGDVEAGAEVEFHVASSTSMGDVRLNRFSGNRN